MADAREAHEGKYVRRIFKTSLWRSAPKLDTDGMLQPVRLQWTNWDSGRKRPFEWGSASQCCFPMSAFDACRSGLAWAFPHNSHCEPSGTARQPTRHTYHQLWHAIRRFLLRLAVRPDNSPDTASHVGETFEANGIDRGVQLERDIQV